jgi:hypothetical protein
VGQAIEVSVTWSTDRQINLPYTIFVHLTDPQGKLVAQADGMPLDGNWPTTCWKPGQAFNDHYTLVIPHTPEDTYQVQIGIYWLSTGERLPVVGPSADEAQRVTIGTVTVDGINNQ